MLADGPRPTGTDQHRRLHRRRLRRAGIPAAAGPRPVRAEPQRRHPRPRLGGDRPGPAQQGPDAAVHPAHVHRNRLTDRSPSSARSSHALERTTIVSAASPPRSPRPSCCSATPSPARRAGLAGVRTTAAAENLGRVDYGVCRGTDPDCYHDWGNFDPATDGYRVLVYSRTAGPRHAHLGPALPARSQPAADAGPRRPERPHQARRGERLRRRLDRGRHAALVAGAPVPLQRGHLHEHHPRHARRPGADRAAAVHPRRRRLRRHPQRLRHRVQLGVVRGPARRRQLLRPRPQPARHGRDDEPPRRLHRRAAGPLGLHRRVVQPRPVPQRVRILAKVDESTLPDGPTGRQRPPRPRPQPPGVVVPVLRRRPVLGHHPRARRRGLDRRADDRRRVLPASTCSAASSRPWAAARSAGSTVLPRAGTSSGVRPGTRRASYAASADQRASTARSRRRRAAAIARRACSFAPICATVCALGISRAYGIPGGRAARMPSRSMPPSPG